MLARPPLPNRRPKVLGLSGWLRRQGVELAQRIAQIGLLGIRQSRGVIICGLPRSGSTLLQLMLENAYPSSRHFGREQSGLRVARQEWPGRYGLIISKRPNDVLRIDDIRAAYRKRARKPCFIVTTRDPRAVLTSKHSGRDGYYVTVDRWRMLFEHIKYVRQFPDVIPVEFRDLVERPAWVQQILVDAIGEAPASSFDSFHHTVPAGFDTRALNGVRPLDASALDKWRRPEHRARIQSILATMPELNDVLIAEGYERDDSWADEYR
jgi:hypothetical protein